MNLDDIKKAQFEATLGALADMWTRTSMGRRLDVFVERCWAAKRAASLNPLVKAGCKYFSQNDEDGITLEILRRISKGPGVFVEFGSGDGLENNTLILLLSGWKGVWIGGSDLRISIPPNSAKLQYVRDFITAENCVALMMRGLTQLGSSSIDFLSIDLDGNDLFIAEAILRSGARPSVVIVEYNAKFPPPIRWSIKYDPQHRWTNDDYHGASIQSFVDLLSNAGYRFVGCNLTGCNAFFVDQKLGAHFADVPTDVATLFYPADYNWFLLPGHAPSARTIERLL